MVLERKIVINRGKRKGKEFRKNEQNSIFCFKEIVIEFIFLPREKKRKLEKIILELRYIALYPGEKSREK